MRAALIAIAAAAMTCASGCSSSEGAGASSGAAAKNGPPADHVFGSARPVNVFRAPETYDPNKPAPLVVILHGYGANGTLQSGFFNLASIADQEGFFIVAPEGTTDSTGKQFWSATEVCCDFEKKGVDDVAYVTGLVDEIGKYYAIDPKRVFVVGHSNGGAMAFRLACDASDRFAAMVDLAGIMFNDPSLCRPKEPVAVLHLHGTNDKTVSYEKGHAPTSLHPNATGLPLPGAVATVSAWAGYNKCGPTPDTSAAPIDVDGDVAGAETRISRYTGCAANGAVELWTMEGTGHVPFNLTKELPKMIWSFLSSHSKP